MDRKSITAILVIVIALNAFTNGLNGDLFRRRLVRKIPTKGSAHKIVFTNDDKLKATKKPPTNEESSDIDDIECKLMNWA